jgi:hypothetical protein
LDGLVTMQHMSWAAASPRNCAISTLNLRSG